MKKQIGDIDKTEREISIKSWYYREGNLLELKDWVDYQVSQGYTKIDLDYEVDQGSVVYVNLLSLK